jgi:hypothetical protein
MDLRIARTHWRIVLALGIVFALYHVWQIFLKSSLGIFLRSISMVFMDARV